MQRPRANLTPRPTFLRQLWHNPAMLPLVLALFACGSPQPEPVDVPQERVEAPVEAEAPPAGSIGGEPILPNAVVVGAISVDDVHAGIAAQRGAIEKCYQDGLQRVPELAGKVLVKFTIGPDGSVESSKMKSTSMRDMGTEICVTESVRTAKFAKLSGGRLAIVHYSFVFPTR